MAQALPFSPRRDTKANQDSKNRTPLLLVLFVVSLLVCAGLGAHIVYRGLTTTVLVAKTELNAGQVLDRSMARRESTDRTEPGQINDIDRVLGRQLLVDKQPGEPLLESDLAIPKRRWLADSVPDGRVLYTLVPSVSSIPLSQIRRGDRIDVLARGPRGARVVARDVIVIGVMRNPNARSSASGEHFLATLTQSSSTEQTPTDSAMGMVVAIRPHDVYPLANVGSSETVSLVLHGELPANRSRLSIEPVQTHREVEIVNGLDRRKIFIRREH